MSAILIRVGPIRRTLSSRTIHIVRTIDELRKHRLNLGNSKVGFVPTMGALHDGHLSLARKAKIECDIVIASIFVNPTQFSAGEDLDKYPRTFEKDLAMLESTGVDLLFAPNLEEIYGKNVLCHVEPSDFSHISEGKARPDFFRGVATIVCKLFNMVTPTVSYFGQKDISQCILVKRMVEDLNMPVRIDICETLRENDGLAMSSRNTYLSPTERNVAKILYKALNSAKLKFDNNINDTSREDLSAAVYETLKSEPMVTEVEYVSIASHLNMKELSVVDRGGGAVISSAIRIGSVRLIDNVLLGTAVTDILGR